MGETVLVVALVARASVDDETAPADGAGGRDMDELDAVMESLNGRGHEVRMCGRKDTEIWGRGER